MARTGPDQALILGPVSLVPQLEHSRAGMLMDVVFVTVFIHFSHCYDKLPKQSNLGKGLF